MGCSDGQRQTSDLRELGLTSLGALARALTERGNPTDRGSAEWTAMQVFRVLARLANLH
jgi:hypothetical protein